MPSPIYTDSQAKSPMFRKSLPFPPSSGGDNFLGPAHPFDLSAHCVRQQELQNISCLTSQRLLPPASQDFLLNGDVIEAMQMYDALHFADGTNRQNMLDCDTVYNDSLMFEIE
jgi:hypothetical protein